MQLRRKRKQWEVVLEVARFSKQRCMEVYKLGIAYKQGGCRVLEQGRNGGGAPKNDTGGCVQGWLLTESSQRA